MCAISVLAFFLMEVEGFRSEWYLDGGHRAIGYGHRFKEGDEGIAPVTRDQALELLIKDIHLARNRAAVDFPQITGKRLNQIPCNLQSAVIAISFHTGSIKTHRKFAAAVAAGDYKTMRQEHSTGYKKNGEWVWLSRRNDIFEETFLQPGKIKDF